MLDVSDILHFGMGQHPSAPCHSSRVHREHSLPIRLLRQQTKGSIYENHKHYRYPIKMCLRTDQ